jgi:Ca2+-binding EF-hand superfamily protein
MKIFLSFLLVSFFSIQLLAEATTNPIMKKFDKNRDGKLFYSEASENLQEHFCQYDVDQDGYLNEKEIKEVPESFAEDDNKTKEP